MPETRITRYMSFAKYIAMLSDDGFFFASPDCLGDSHEGRLGPKDREAITPKARELYPRKHPNEAFLKWEGNEWQDQLLGVVVSCWYRGDTESNAMWQIYGQAIAIESTVERISAALDPYRCECRDVEYVWYEDRPVTGPEPVDVLSYKRPPFQDEHEVRFFYHLNDNYREGLKSLRQFGPRAGHFVWVGAEVVVRSSGVVLPVRLNETVDRVVIGPEAPDWLHHAAFTATIKFGLPHELIGKSTLDVHPYDGLVSHTNPPKG